MQILLLLRLFGMVAIAEHKKGDRSKLRSPFLYPNIEGGNIPRANLKPLTGHSEGAFLSMISNNIQFIRNFFRLKIGNKF